MGKISIIMNCFNGEKYLREALDSVLAQSYKNWELIFWDNQSVDKSAEIFKSYSDLRLKYFYANKHTLLNEARNYAISKSDGEFVAFLDVDDFWLPQKLESQLTLFDDKDVGLVCSNYIINNVIKGRTFLANRKNMLGGFVTNDLLSKYYVGLLTLVVRRSALPTTSLIFDNRFHHIGDFDLVIRLSQKWKLGVVKEALASYRLHGANESIKYRENHMKELETWIKEQLINPDMSKFSNLSAVENLIIYHKAINCLIIKDKVSALNLFKKLNWSFLKLRLLFICLMPYKLFIFIKN